MTINIPTPTSLIKNWRTTSAGLTMIIGAVTHLVFAVRAKTADENTWTTSLLAVAGGCGLIFAGDGAASATKDEVAAVSAKTEQNTAFLMTVGQGQAACAAPSAPGGQGGSAPSNPPKAA
jgi:threonine/homoserine/homoserine lactone efflux protein